MVPHEVNQFQARGRSVFLLLTLLTPDATAFCGTYVGSAGADLYNSGSQIAIARQGDQTTLTLVNDYQGDLTDFALIIPVPEALTEQQVSLADDLIMAAADAYSAPRLVSYECDDVVEPRGCSGDGCGPFANEYDLKRQADSSEGIADTVEVVEAFTVGAYQFVVLDAEQSAGLYQWLDEQGYAVPAGGEALLDQYIDAGSYFLAAKVSLEAVDADEVWLAPIQLRYSSEVFSLPIRIGTLASPGVQDLIVYTITDRDDGEVRVANYPEVELEQECMWDPEGSTGLGGYYQEQFDDAVDEAGGAGWFVEYSWSPSGCDPCSSDPLTDSQLGALGYDGDSWDAHFTRLHLQYTPETATEDLMLYTTGIGATSQVRYIVYKEDLEYLYPICGEGFPEEPGECRRADTDDGGCSSGPGGPRGPLGLALLGLGLGALLRRRG